MGESELELLADLIADKVVEKQGECSLTPEEQQAVKELLRTRKSAVRAFIYILGAIALWILRDVYHYINSHLSFR